MPDIKASRGGVLHGRRKTGDIGGKRTLLKGQMLKIVWLEHNHEQLVAVYITVIQ